MYNKILNVGICKVKVCLWKVKVKVGASQLYINKTSHSISLHKSVPSVIFVLTSPPHYKILKVGICKVKVYLWKVKVKVGASQLYINKTSHSISHYTKVHLL